MTWQTPPRPYAYQPLPMTMSRGESALHVVLIICTLGLWLPVYVIRRRALTSYYNRAQKR